MRATTGPGVYELTADEYHADPVPGGSLTSTGARRLLPPSCPALFRHDLDHPQPPRRTFDVGHAAHKLVLGTGPDLVIIDAADYRTKAAREERDAAHEAGKVPLLEHEHDQVEAMAAALRGHSVAAALLDPARGRPEQTLVWDDRPTGVTCRARLDWLPDLVVIDAAGRLIVPDYKTCHSADPEALAKSVASFGYHQQAAWYLAGINALGLAGPAGAAFVFLCQEKSAPYLVTIVELDGTALRIGEARNRRALAAYDHCRTTGVWPAYVDGVHLLSLPRWAEIAEGEHLP
jgi:hypothetical protein